jgi:hypothetical protein
MYPVEGLFYATMILGTSLTIHSIVKPTLKSFVTIPIGLVGAGIGAIGTIPFLPVQIYRYNK